jgi:hypothetical protein
MSDSGRRTLTFDDRDTAHIKYTGDWFFDGDQPPEANATANWTFHWSNDLSVTFGFVSILSFLFSFAIHLTLNHIQDFSWYVLPFARSEVAASILIHTNTEPAVSFTYWAFHRCCGGFYQICIDCDPVTPQWQDIDAIEPTDNGTLPAVRALFPPNLIMF